MNREIKFRFWVHFGDYDENDNPVYEMIYGDSFAFEEYAPINELMKETENFKVMQYTGLKDKDGKEIYEGDIVKLIDLVPLKPIEFVGSVKFLECRYMIDNGKDRMFLFSETSEIEVIGNIYENPELLTK